MAAGCVVFSTTNSCVTLPLFCTSNVTLPAAACVTVGLTVNSASWIPTLWASGVAAVAAGWPLSLPGPFLMFFAAAVALRAVWGWERTRVVVTTEKLFVVHGIVRRRAAAVHLARVGAVEVEQSLLGRLLGYGTVIAGELEIPYVPQPRELARLVA